MAFGLLRYPRLRGVRELCNDRCLREMGAGDYFKAEGNGVWHAKSRVQGGLRLHEGDVA